MTAIQLIKDELSNARGIFEGTVIDLKQSNLHIIPEGKALPIGSIYAHSVFSEDIIVNGMLRRITPLSKGKYEDNTGTNIPMPAMDENWSRANEQWAREVQINLPVFLEFKTAVFTTTDTFVANLTDIDLDTDVELGVWGKMKISFVLYSMVIAHMNNLAGEISALKGLQGLKGYPF